VPADDSRDDVTVVGMVEPIDGTWVHSLKRSR
jgi:hypothetical protein